MPPKICLFYITLKCNDTCEFCGCWRGADSFDQEASLDKIAAVLDSLSGIEELVLTGGEPLMSDNLVGTLKHAKRRGLNTALFTNCLLYPERAKEIAGMVDDLFFSLDYPYPEMHNRSRGRALFNKVIKSIEVATRLNVDPLIFFTVTRDSILYLPETVEFCEKFSVKLFLNPVYDFAGTQGFTRDSLAYLRYYGRRRNIFINLAALEFIYAGGNNSVFPRCRAKETVVTLLPSAKVVSPCFFNQNGRQGREEACSGCMRWPYMLPSFTVGIDKYRILDWYSRRKLQTGKMEVKL